MVSCFCGRSSTLSVAWDESVWHKASSSNITSDGSSKDSRLRWNRIGWSDSCQIWGKLLSRLRYVTTTIDISGIERSSRLKMLWYMTRSQMLKKVESNGWPIFKVVLECQKGCSEPFYIYIYGIQRDFMPKVWWENNFGSNSLRESSASCAGLLNFVDKLH